MLCFLAVPSPVSHQTVRQIAWLMPLECYQLGQSLSVGLASGLPFSLSPRDIFRPKNSVSARASCIAATRITPRLVLPTVPERSPLDVLAAESHVRSLQQQRPESERLRHRPISFALLSHLRAQTQRPLQPCATTNQASAKHNQSHAGFPAVGDLCPTSFFFIVS